MTTDDLTGAALDEAIARALGWQQILGGWVNPDGGGELMLRWSWDVSAALALCLEICDARDDLTELVIFANGQLSYAELWREVGGGKREKLYVMPFVMPDGLALALARLALAAL